MKMFSDETETELRKDFVAQNTAAVRSDNIEHEVVRLKEIHGDNNVWTTEQVREQFDVTSFLAPFCMVVRKSDGQKGVLEFQHSPRVYFNYQAQ